MNEVLTRLYRASRPKEALVSQDEFKSANALLGSDVERFAELLINECADIAKHNVMNISTYADAEFVEEQIKKHFGVNG